VRLVAADIVVFAGGALQVPTLAHTTAISERSHDETGNDVART
jgi:hypothetical protein